MKHSLITRISKHRNHLLPVLAVLAFALAWFACRQLLLDVNLIAIHQAIISTPIINIMLALAATAISFTMLFGYEWSADKYAGAHLPTKTLAFGSFCAFAIGNTVGLSIFSGGAIRYRLYSACGLEASKIIKMTLFIICSLGLTLPFLTAFLIILQSSQLADLMAFPQPALIVSSIFILFCYLAGTIYFYQKRALLPGNPDTWSVALAGHKIELPGAKLATGQFLITTLDISFAGMVLYFLLNAPLSPFEFLPVYFIAVAGGVISHVPGGLGVFEALILAAFGPKMGTASVAAALVLYRLIYIFLPFGLAALALLANETKRLRFNFLSGSHSKLPALILAVLVFISGVILLFSVSTPALHDRLYDLVLFIPESLIETSHLLVSIIGFICLLLAQGLYRKLSGAWFLTLIMLIGGIIFSLLKGLDWEEAAFLALVAVLTHALKPYFYRKSRLSHLAVHPQYLLVIAAVLAASIWLSLFSYKNISYNNQLFWQFSLDDHVSRSLRAMVICAILLIALALRWLMRPPFTMVTPNADDLAKAWLIFKSSSQPDGALVMTGDKSVLFNDANDAFIMYGHHGKSLVALHDPIGPESSFADIIWEFKDLCDRSSLRPIIYQVKEDYLSYYIDIGLVVVKIGEEAIVDLKKFSMDSNKSKKLRYLYNHGLKEGLTMEVYEAGKAPLDKLKIVSDQWLANKKARELGFSLGRFDENYLKYCKIAVLKQYGIVIAFTNLLETNHYQHASFDLMRYSNQAPKSSMGFLIISLMLYYKNLGMDNLNLGMVPLSGLKKSPRDGALLFRLLASYIYENGAYFYNFKGLRQFKEKFNPAWRSRYIALPGRNGQTFMALKDASALISGGVRGLINK